MAQEVARELEGRLVVQPAPIATASSASAPIARSVPTATPKQLDKLYSMKSQARAKELVREIAGSDVPFESLSTEDAYQVIEA